ncbi:MAG: FlxA-like family protein [Lachnospiraceae bacterium]|nr:FlxA-like family protein [Lachnospiraceae bacterium]
MKVNSTANGVNMQAGQMGLHQEDDMISKNLKKQIDNLQKELQELSANTQLGGEEKMKKRQEIQKQISDLNMQLRQHQIELRKEKQQEKASSDNIFESASMEGKTKASDKGNGMTQASMEAMISADVSMKQAAKQGSVATKMEGRAGVLEMEIKLDSARGGNVDAKQEELAKTKQKAEDASAAQISTLGKANKAMKEAADSESGTKEAEGTEKDEDAKEAGNSKIGDGTENTDEEKDKALRAGLVSVDVRI